MWGRLGSQSIAVAALAFFVSTSFLAAAAISPKPDTPADTSGNGDAGESPGLLNIGSRGCGGHLRYVFADLPSYHEDATAVVEFNVDQPMSVDRSVVVVSLREFIGLEVFPDLSGAILTVREGFGVASAEVRFAQCDINGRSQPVGILIFSQIPPSGNYKL